MRRACCRTVAPPSPDARVTLQTGSVIGVLCMILVQFLALVWYTLSYIPYARDLVWRMMANCCRGS